MSKTVYILLTRSTTWFSQLIHLFTQEDYTHASIGFATPQGHFYSFGRKRPEWPLPGGLIKEGLDRGFFFLHPDTPCVLYALKVEDEAYEALRDRVAEMYEAREGYHYNLLGVVSCFFRLPLPRADAYFCSQFVAELLTESGAAQLENIPALTHPMDLSKLKELRVLYIGDVGALSRV